MTTTSCTLVDSQRLRAGYTVVSKYRGRGIPASAIPTGFAQGPLLLNDISASDPAGTQYRVELPTYPTAGVLVVYEDSSISFTGAPDGTYTGPEIVYKNGVPDNGSYSFTIGAAVQNPTPTPDTTGPTFQGPIVVSGITQTTAVLTWAAATDPSGVAGYERSIGGSAYTSIGATTSNTLNGLTAGTAYDVQIRAIDSSAANNRSAALSVRVTTASAPPQGQTMAFTPSASRTVSIQPGRGSFIVGAFFDLTDPKKPLGVMDPDAVLDFTFNWAAYLADIGNPGIAKADFILNGVTNAGATSSAASASVFVSMNALVTMASITCRITTNSVPPVVDDRTIYLKFEDK